MHNFSQSPVGDNTVGNRIKALRCMRGLNQKEFGEQLAESIGRKSPYTVAYISALETGRKQPASSLREALGNFFGIDAKVFENPNTRQSFKPDRLKTIRTQKGVSQRKLIRNMSRIRGKSYNPNYISLLERGKSSPSRAAVAQIASVLGIQPDELYSV